MIHGRAIGVVEKTSMSIGRQVVRFCRGHRRLWLWAVGAVPLVQLRCALYVEVPRATDSSNAAGNKVLDMVRAVMKR